MASGIDLVKATRVVGCGIAAVQRIKAAVPPAAARHGSLNCARESWFATDSALGGAGFEPLVPGGDRHRPDLRPDLWGTPHKPAAL